MAFSVGGSQNLGGSGGGDQRRMLPPGFPSQKLAPSPYQGFQHPPLYDAGRGHNLPLVPEGPVGLFTVLKKQDDSGEVDEEDDCVWCTGRDPSTGRLYTRVPVAKPFHLQRTPWDGFDEEGDPNDKVFLDSGTFVRYEYDNKQDDGRQIGFRFRQRVDGEHVDTIPQEISPSYFADDILTVAKAVHMPVFGEPATTEHGSPIEFVDLNGAGRSWRGEDSLVCHVIILEPPNGNFANLCDGVRTSPAFSTADRDSWYDNYVAQRNGTYVFFVGFPGVSSLQVEQVRVQWRESPPNGSPVIRASGVRGKYLKLRVSGDKEYTSVSSVVLKAPLLVYRSNSYGSLSGTAGPLENFLPLTEQWKSYLEEWFGDGMKDHVTNFGPAFQNRTIGTPSELVCDPIPGLSEVGIPDWHQVAADWIEAIFVPTS